MPWESLGSCGSGDIGLRLAILYLAHVCGEPPPGCELDVMWHDHELGNYPTIGVCWDPYVRTEAPWEYISHCEIALSIFDEAVDYSNGLTSLPRTKSSVRLDN